MDAAWLKNDTQIFSALQTHELAVATTFEVLHCNYQRPTHLNSILQDLFRDTPFDHIWRAQLRTQIWPSTVFGQ